MQLSSRLIKWVLSTENTAIKAYAEQLFKSYIKRKMIEYGFGAYTPLLDNISLIDIAQQINKKRPLDDIVDKLA